MRHYNVTACYHVKSSSTGLFPLPPPVCVQHVCSTPRNLTAKFAHRLIHKLTIAPELSTWHHSNCKPMQ